MRTWLCIALSIVFLSVRAQDEQRGGKVVNNKATDTVMGNTYAVIVGVSTYNKLNPLHYADEDAKLFEAYLLSKPGGNTPRDNIKVYLNGEATGTAIETSSFQWLNTKAIKKGDKVYFFLAGHGDGVEEDYFFLSVDADTTSGPRNFRIQGNLDITQLKKSLTRYVELGADVCLLIDACRTNENSNAGDKERSANFSKISRSNASLDAFPFIHSLYATVDGSPAYESEKIGRGHGIFTYYLVNGLFGKADNEVVGDKNGWITLWELATWLKKIVEQKSDTLFRKKQSPQYCCNTGDTKIIARVDPVFFKSYDSLLATIENSLDDTVYIQTTQLAKRQARNKSRNTQLLATYNAFYEALEEARFMGNNSAETYFNSMVSNFPGHEPADEARIELINKLISYAQKKINLYLSGFDVGYVRKIKEDYNVNDKTLIEVQRVSLVNFGDAAEYMKKAIQLTKNSEGVRTNLEPKLWFLQARSYFDVPKNKMQVDEAIKLAKNALAKDTGAVHLLFLLGMLEQEKNKRSELADQYFLKALAGESRWSKVNLEIGYLYYKLGQFGKAEQFYQKAILTNRDQSSAYNNLAILFEKQKNFEQAQAMYIKALEKRPDDSILRLNFANFYNDRGIFYKNKSEFSTAEKQFERSIDADSGFIVPYINLGNNYMAQKKYDKAEVYYLKAMNLRHNIDYYAHILELNYKPEHLLYNLGLCYFENKQFKKARPYFEECIKVTGKENYFHQQSLLFLDKSVKLAEKGPGTVVIKYEGKLFRIDTTISNLHSANEYFKYKMLPEAEQYYIRALAEDTASCEVLRKLAEINRAKRNYEVEFGYLYKCITNTPSDLDAVLQLGKILNRQRKFEETEKIYLLYHQKFPDDRKMITQLINLYYIMEKKREAKKFEKEFDRVLKKQYSK